MLRERSYARDASASAQANARHDELMWMRLLGNDYAGHLKHAFERIKDDPAASAVASAAGTTSSSAAGDGSSGANASPTARGPMRSRSFGAATPGEVYFTYRYISCESY